MTTSTSNYTSYSQGSLSGSTFTPSGTFSGSPNNLTDPNASFSVGDTVSWRLNGSTFSPQYLGYVTYNSNQYPLVSLSGTPYLLNDGVPNQALSFSAGTLGCFVHDTRIATPRGQVAVQDLAAGDQILTHDSRTETIVWIGQQTIDCTTAAAPESVWPIRIAACAFGPGLPARDLYVSADHAIYVDEVLVPARHLVNGSTITQERRDQVVYFHIKLARHDVILAEGLAAESYLDVGGSAHADGMLSAVYGKAAVTEDIGRLWETHGYAPLVVAGPRLMRIRAWLDEQAGVRSAAA